MLRHSGNTIHHVSSKSGGCFNLNNGKRLYDASGGSLVQTLSNMSLDMPIESIESLLGFNTPYARFDSDAKQSLQAQLLELAGSNYSDILWANSGSDAVESALWAAEIYSVETYKSKPKSFIVRRGGYHGNTELCRKISSRIMSDDKLNESTYVLDEYDSCSTITEYEPFNEKLLSDDENPLLDALKNLIENDKCEFPAVLILEGYPTTGWKFITSFEQYQAILKYCKDKPITVIFDEVASGSYRHGQLSVCNSSPEKLNDSLKPDVLVLSKGLTSGSFPLGCCLLSSNIVDVIIEKRIKSISFTHGLTELSAYLTLSCLARYNKIFNDANFNCRKTYLMSLHRQYSDEFYNKQVGMEKTDTSLRLDITPKKITKLSSELESNGYWTYIGSANIAISKNKFANRNFLHICPPFDINSKSQFHIFSDVIDIALNSL